MYSKFDFGQEEERRIVYVREVALDELPDDVRAQLSEDETLYAVHNADGERLALVKDRNLAFILARQNDFDPVTVH
ncbi:DUF1150 family protein [Shimia aestuarii]|uniref:DUF1150 family protein n=1 Tax=Shimia aestuarii TaxID=254406 RepID=A0A1I4I1B4_9RHOB|nr:DUF1150 family protein [Shimia aestuarii]SFL48232.1 hypothetical protein SAMN04488042_101376 [Shimia aestuarii]